MSGIEVVGLVLGAIPLVISGLEHYAEGASTIKRAFKAHLVFKSLARDLETQNLLFRNSLEILLTDCVDLDTQKALLDNVGGRKWHDADIQKALEARLQESLHSYLKHVQHIEDSLEEFKKWLLVKPDGKIAFDSTFSFKEAYKRLNLAMRFPTYEGRLRAIRDDVSVLNQLAQSSKTLLSAKKIRRIPDFDKVRSSATSIFQCLHRGLHATCALSHKASMYLKPSKSDLLASKDLRNVAKSEDTFRIVLHHDLSVAKLSKPLWTLEETEIRLLEALPSGLTPLPQATAGAESKLPTRRTVSFQEPATLATTEAKEEAMKEIQNLCQSIENFRAVHCGVCLGYLAGAGHAAGRHALYWPKQKLLEDSTVSVLSLTDIFQLQKSQQTERLRSRDTYQLAVALATGLLRLHDTPWLKKDWSKADITLIRQNDKILAEHPFISATLDPQMNPLSHQKSKKSPIRNQALFTLGIILIEICLRKPMNELHQPDELNDDGTPHGLSDFYAAERLIRSEELSGELGDVYSNVVRRCIFCDLDQSIADLTNLSFRKAVYNYILVELEDNCRKVYGFGIDRI